MQSVDVLIVGGGPAGSTCAWRLQEAGLDVLVLDKQRFPRDKVCAGWITPAVVEALEFDVEKYRRSHVCQPIKGFRIGMIGGNEVQAQYGETVSFGIRRCEFDHYLLNRSRAPCRLGEPLKTMRRDRDRWIVNEDISAGLLVGAGGHFCPVARFLGDPRDGCVPVVAAQEIEFEATPEELRSVHVDAETPELFFCDDLRGYGWCFRKGDVLNVGLGRVDKGPLSSHVRSFCQFLRERKKVCCPLPSRFRGHAYRLYERAEPKLLDAGVLLVGDAAGLACPQSGEGIRPAVESALMAADVILAAAGKYGREQLEPYRTAVTQRFGKPRAGSLSERLPAGWIRPVASRLLATHWFARNVVLDRWFLQVTRRPKFPR